MKVKGISASMLVIAFALVGPAIVVAEGPTNVYAPDFVSAVARATAMNDAGDFVGYILHRPRLRPLLPGADRNGGLEIGRSDCPALFAWHHWHSRH
jgi:hypothetical protein